MSDLAVETGIDPGAAFEEAPFDPNEALDPLSGEFGSNLVGLLQERDEFLLDRIGQVVKPAIDSQQAAAQAEAEQAVVEQGMENIRDLLAGAGVPAERHDETMELASDLFARSLHTVHPDQHNQFAQHVVNQAAAYVAQQALEADGHTRAKSLMADWRQELGQFDSDAVFARAKELLPDFEGRYKDDPERASVAALYSAAREATGNDGDGVTDTVKTWQAVNAALNGEARYGGESAEDGLSESVRDALGRWKSRKEG